MARNRGRRSSPLYVTPAFDLLPASYDYVKANFKVFVILFLFPMVIGLSNGYWVVDSRRHLVPDVLNAASSLGNATLPAYSYAHFGITFLIALAIGVVIQIMANAAQLQASEDKKVRLTRVWRVVKQHWLKMLGLYTVISVLTAIGLALLVIPGLIVLRRYFFAPYVLLENQDLSIWQAMEKSAEISKRNSRSVYEMLAVMLLFSLFGIVPLIGWIAAFALHFYYSVAPAIRYRELKRLG